MTRPKALKNRVAEQAQANPGLYVTIPRQNRSQATTLSQELKAKKMPVRTFAFGDMVYVETIHQPNKGTNP